MVQDILGLEQPRLPLLVGVEAADVVDRALLQRLQQIGQIAEIPQLSPNTKAFSLGRHRSC